MNVLIFTIFDDCLGLGSLKQRLGTDSQLPFGYCSLSLQPSVEPVVTPSGRIYSRESMLEYLLAKSKELKQAQIEYEAQQVSINNVYNQPILLLTCFLPRSDWKKKGKQSSWRRKKKNETDFSLPTPW
ncbi:hypothetical protein EON64_09690 [archaeon]|nr:MAG: hypothetical protein EON64_09690 [archaeon]